MGEVQLGRHGNVVAEIASVRLLNAAGETASSPAGGKSGVIAPRLEWRVQTHANARKKQRSVV